jgi:haloacetate dehalogenase
LAQPAPLPERLLAADPEAVVDNALGGWGSDPAAFDPATRAAYAAALKDPAHAHAICEEYRAGAADGLDVAHDRADLAAGRRIGAPLLALWSKGGALGSWYADEGGPLALWRRYAGAVEGEAVAGGHFFPEEDPAALAARLAAFFAP